MATKQPQDQPRKKRTRAKVPKGQSRLQDLRTASVERLIYRRRRRHLKCDEAKPSYLRCVRDKWTCNGYSQSSPESFYVTGTSSSELPWHPKSDQMTSWRSSSFRASLTGPGVQLAEGYVLRDIEDKVVIVLGHTSALGTTSKGIKSFRFASQLYGQQVSLVESGPEACLKPSIKLLAREHLHKEVKRLFRRLDRELLCANIGVNGGDASALGLDLLIDTIDLEPV
ncbi:hypothetical protein FGRMN_11230 [Fusarium graminum]|nr:hypothetical protein FGRMN_11230 [Fusarium graminum]